MNNRYRSFISVVGISLVLIILASGFFLSRVSGANDNDRITQTTPAAKNSLGAKLEQTYVLADFNGDGLMDVAVTDFVHDTVSVMIGDRAGYFHSVVKLSSAGGPRAIVAADFNRDGAIDLAVTGFFSGDVAIFLGRADGSFQNSHSVNLSGGLTSIIAEDFNSDGLLDLAAANFLSGEIAILKGSGDGSFETQAIIGQVRTPTLILGHDFDRDGLQDLVAFGASEKEVRLFTGEGNGSFKDAGNIDPATAISFERGKKLAGGEAGELRALRKLLGEGQSALAGTALPQPLVIEVDEQDKLSRAGRQVTFSILYGDARLEAGNTRTTDERGQASLALSLDELPGNNLVAATVEGQVAVFGEFSTFSYGDFFAKIRDALAQLPLEDSNIREQHALLDEAERKAGAGDEIGAVATLRDSLDLLTGPRSLQPGESQSVTGAIGLTKRLINQVLLLSLESLTSPTIAILCGQTIPGNIATLPQVDTYTFSGNANEAVKISAVATSGTLCTRAELYRGATFLGSNGCNSNTSSIVLPATDTYTIRVFDLGLNDTGTYDVNLQFTTGRCGTVIACGQTFNGPTAPLSRARQDTYKFNGNANEAVKISAIATSGTLCARAELYDPSGTFLGSNGCNSNTSSIVLPVTGVYTILVYDLGFNDTGAYDVNLQFTTGRCGTPITCGLTLGGNISSKARQDTYKFNGNANEAVKISAIAISGSLCARAELYDPSGTFLGSNGCNSSTSSLVLPATGVYTILVYDLGFNDTGAYDVNLQFTTGRCGTPISCGAMPNGNITSRAQQDTFTFNGSAGCSVIVNAVATSGTLCARAELYSPSGTFLGSNGCNSSTSSIVLPVTGIYTILVYDLGFNDTGAYKVTLTCAGNNCPSPRTLEVASTPSSGVNITVSPPDINGQSNGTTSFTRIYNNGASVTLTAPATAGGNNFQKWQRDGVDVATTQTVPVTMDANHTMTAVYVPPPPTCSATYDPALKAPKCSAVGSVCDSCMLLNGRDNITGGAEPNQPNTINNSCTDGTSGSYHVDESIDRIKVSTLDGSNFAPGKQVRIDVTVWAYVSFTSDQLDLYYAANANNPNWTYITTLTPTGAGVQTLSAIYTLPPVGGTQAVRARFRYGGTASPCGSGSYNDHDDLIFTVGGATLFNNPATTNPGSEGETTTENPAGIKQGRQYRGQRFPVRR